MTRSSGRRPSASSNSSVPLRAIQLPTLMAAATLKAAFRTDVEPILAMARHEKGAAIDPVAAFRRSGYRARVAAERPAVAGGSGGIV